jgi:hypothetical protein
MDSMVIIWLFIGILIICMLIKFVYWRILYKKNIFFFFTSFLHLYDHYDKEDISVGENKFVNISNLINIIWWVAFFIAGIILFLNNIINN